MTERHAGRQQVWIAQDCYILLEGSANTARYGAVVPATVRPLSRGLDPA